MNKTEIKNVMAEVGCPLAKNPGPKNGKKNPDLKGSEKKRSKVHIPNIIDLRSAAKGYDGSMDWRTWVDFMLAVYNMQQNRHQSKTALAKHVFLAAEGYEPWYPTMIYQADQEMRKRVERVLVQAARYGEITFNSNTPIVRAIAHSRGIPMYTAARMVYDRMLTMLEWTRLKAEYMETNGAGYVDRHILTAQSPELIALFHDTAKAFLNESRRTCPMLHETSAQIAL